MESMNLKGYLFRKRYSINLWWPSDAKFWNDPYINVTSSNSLSLFLCSCYCKFTGRNKQRNIDWGVEDEDGVFPGKRRAVLNVDEFFLFVIRTQTALSLKKAAVGMAKRWENFLRIVLVTASCISPGLCVALSFLRLVFSTSQRDRSHLFGDGRGIENRESNKNKETNASSVIYLRIFGVVFIDHLELVWKNH